ncbi:hypothetical protein PR003_g1250 [Phytophthora rubi]|uniref:Uncharacterized protein n=1 Tax=Phytophthora rubi TaxID=129364 RepID=A0A6A3NN42_9STRA|nr:hypothetical protein PR002_g1944 [Phytophthora rubi]KAE9046900.1 hypothetical protein PR001_g4400 [Phytophthora rubi]KAE9358509.1 hypothetical protein PR003_g1250 [Phytophthora rubi]
MDLSIDDSNARIFRYYEDFSGIVEGNVLQRLFGNGDEYEKARCRLLVDNLQPPVLKSQISRLIDLERRVKNDDVALFDLILEFTTTKQRFHQMSQYHAARGDSSRQSQNRNHSELKPAGVGGHCVR